MNGKFEIAIKGQDAFSISAFAEEWFVCPVRTGVDANGERDQDDPYLNVLGFQEEKIDGGIRYTWRTCSNLWKRKEYVLEAVNGAARFFVRVEGKGSIDALRFFEGGASYEAAGYFLPVAANADLKGSLQAVTRSACIDLGYYVPPCYVYPFYMDGAEGWLGVGLAARAGQYNFDEFRYQVSRGGCGFEVPLNGQTAVNGVWESQSLLFVTGRDGYDVIRSYAEWHYNSGWCVRKDRSDLPDWWKKPIFCGWGEQGALWRNAGCKTQQDYATQAAYQQMSDQLDACGLNPGVIIIDDKWQDGYGSAMPDQEKWPSLRSFADKQHAKGRKVVLWFRSWDPEGLKHDECIEYLCTACAADPTSPAYLARMKEVMRILLSDEDGCCNCDGFKIDFANCMPLGKYVMCHEEGVYGVELLKRFFVMMRDLAKAVKPDALINSSCAHPYFDEIVDQLRIHDYWGRSAPEIMGHRAAIAAAALPGVLIDTDAGGTDSKRDFYRWIKAQPDIGIPDLYNITAVDAVPFDEECIELIRQSWNRYEEKLKTK